MSVGTHFVLAVFVTNAAFAVYMFASSHWFAGGVNVAASIHAAYTLYQIYRGRL